MNIFTVYITCAWTQVCRASTSATRKISASPGGSSLIGCTVTGIGWVDSLPTGTPGTVRSPVRFAISETVQVRERLTRPLTMVVLDV